MSISPFSPEHQYLGPWEWFWCDNGECLSIAELWQDLYPPEERTCWLLAEGYNLCWLLKDSEKVGKSMGNPWVFFYLSIPIPMSTHTCNPLSFFLFVRLFKHITYHFLCSFNPLFFPASCPKVWELMTRVQDWFWMKIRKVHWHNWHLNI